MHPDPILTAASAIHARPGAYALLLGSGVSMSSGIPTGWAIVLHLIRRLGALEGADTEAVDADPAAWYSSRFEEGVDYSVLLEALAPAPADRLALLDPYFEPSEEEAAQGLRGPQAAHRAIARLVRRGYVNVIITTNFDRLVETALAAEGIEPFVVASSDDAAHVPPLHTLDACLVVKVHGDRRSPNLKNTAEELASYDRPLADLLKRILSDHGLIVCGWSAESDPALKDLVVRHQQPFFSTFWCHRSAPREVARGIIDARAARTIAGDSDEIFESLDNKVRALEGLLASSTLSAEVAAQEVKNLIPRPEAWIELRDFVLREVDRAVQRMDAIQHPSADPDFTGEAYGNLIESYIEAVEVVVTVLAVVAHFGETDRHDQLLLEAVSRLANVPIPVARRTFLGQPYRIGLAVCIHAVGCALLAGGRFDSVAPRLFGIKIQERDGRMTDLLDLVVGPQVLHQPALAAAGYASKTAETEVLLRAIDGIRAPLMVGTEQLVELIDSLEILFGIELRSRSGWSFAGQGIVRHRFETEAFTQRVASEHMGFVLSLTESQEDAQKLIEEHGAALAVHPYRY